MDTTKEKFKFYVETASEVLQPVDMPENQRAAAIAEYATKLMQLEAQILQIDSDTLKNLIQSKAMLRSVRDNMIISKNNCYIGFLNTLLNATAAQNSNTKASVDKILKQIDKMDENPLDLDGELEKVIAQMREKVKK